MTKHFPSFRRGMRLRKKHASFKTTDCTYYYFYILETIVAYYYFYILETIVANFTSRFEAVTFWEEPHKASQPVGKFHGQLMQRFGSEGFSLRK